uniref:non-specific protein-tyrosine kinase n=1 Tax=Gopherus evgoodei TaxID=1825980 RepID=A0A8C4VVG9_9SAUR
PLYTSLWDFDARTRTEISFQAGDLFQVIRQEGEWWWARKVDGSNRILAEGYVPYNYLAEQETMEAESSGLNCEALQDLAELPGEPLHERCALLPGSAQPSGALQSEESYPRPETDNPLLEARTR